MFHARRRDIEGHAHGGGCIAASTERPDVEPGSAGGKREQGGRCVVIGQTAGLLQERLHARQARASVIDDWPHHDRMLGERQGEDRRRSAMERPGQPGKIRNGIKTPRQSCAHEVRCSSTSSAVPDLDARR